MRREAQPGVTARRVGALLAVVTTSGVCGVPLMTATVADAAPPTIASAVLVNDASNPAVSAITSGDGRWTIYYQGGRLWASDASGVTGNKVMVGRTTAGEELPLSNSSAVSDQTGRFVAFTGYVDLYNPSSNLLGSTTYLHDRDTDGDGVFDEPGSISTIQLGARLTNTVLEPSISSDGRYVGFLQPDVSATVDVAQSNKCIRAYRYDRLTRAIIDLTLPDNDAPPACDPTLSSSRDLVYRVRLSADGGSAALETGWETLAPTTLQTAFRFGVVRDVTAGTTERLIFDGTINNNNVSILGFSGDARYVLALGEANSALLRLDRGTPLTAPNTTLTIPVGPSSFAIALSGDGRAVISGTSTGTRLWRSSGTVSLTSGEAFSASLNLDGSVATITTTTPPAGVVGHGVGFTDAYRFEVQATASYTLSAGLSLDKSTTPPAATAIPIGSIPADVVRTSNLDLAGAPLGGKGVAPIGGKGVAPIGGKGAAPLGGKGAAPLGGKGAAPLGGKGAAPLGGKGVAALDDLTAVRNLPLAMIPVAGGWATLLTGTPLAGRPVQTVTLGQVIDKAPGALAALRPDQLDLRRTVLADATPAAWALGTTPVRQLTYSGGATFCQVLRNAQDPVPGASADAFCDATGITPTMTMFQIDLDPRRAGVVATAPELHSPPIAQNLPALRAGDGEALHSAPLLDLPLPALGLGVSRAGNIPLVELVEAGGPVASLALTALGNLTAVADCPLVGCSASGTATLGDARTARVLRTDATLRSISVELPAIKLDDVAAQLVADVDLNDLLIGTLEADQFPWEELDLVTSGVQQYVPNPNSVRASIPLDVCPGVTGDCLDPVSGTVTLTLPRSFRVRTGSASIDGAATVGAVNTTSTASSTVVTIAVGNVTPGVTATLGVDLLPGFTLGSYTVAAKAVLAGKVFTPTSVQVKVVEPADAAGTAADAATAAADTLYVSYVTTPGDVDLFRVPAASGKIVSVWVSHFERDADVVLYGPRTTSVSSRSNRAAGPTTGAVADDGADGGTTAPAASSEAARDLPAQPGLTPVASSATAVDGGTESATALGADLVQISAYSGVTSSQPYVLRIRTDATITPAACTYSPANAGFTTGTAAGSFSMPTGLVETLVLNAPERFGRKYGAASVAEIDAKLAVMLSMPGASAAVVDVASDSAVAAAFGGWNAAWCDYDAANRVVRALTDLITRVHDAHPELRSVVIVGGDDILPMARLDDTTRLANEDSYADDVPAGPLHEALRTRHFLSDDPYADLDPIPFVDRQIFVPDLSVGRLVEDASEIGAAIDAYVTAGGRLDPAAAYVTGYDFMADGANLAADRLEAAFKRAGAPSNLAASRLVGNTWTAQQAIAGLGGAGASGLYAHFGYNLGMSAAGFERDKSTSFTASPDTFSPAQVAGALRLPNAAPIPRLLFSMGCHAGLSVPGDTDFAQAIVGTGAMFVGVSSYGLGNTVGTALNERLMASFAGNLDGQLVNGKPMTVGEALTQAKQDYWAGQGLYGPYDEKVLQSTVFYGLPMYRVAPAGAANPPVRSTPAPVTPSPTASPYRSHSVAVASAFVTNTVASTGTKYVSIGSEEPLSVPNRPVQPRTITEITASDGTNLLPAHGGLVTSLSAATSITGFAATFPRPTAVDSSVEPSAVPVDVAFPSSLVAITTASDLAGQPQADGGPRQRQYLVTVPGRFRSGDTPGVGTQDLFGGVGVDVLYSASTDYASPRIGTTRAIVSAGAVAFTVDTTDDSTAGVQRVLVLYRTPSGWVALDLTPPVAPGGSWTGAGAGVTSGTFEYLVQSVDSAGNVGTGAGKGRGVAAYTPPVVGNVVAFISDGQFVEGSGGGTTAGAVNLTLDRPAPAGGLSFGVALQSGTAAVGSAAGDDVSSTVTNVVVPQGALSAPVSFAIAADGGIEGDQAFTVTVTAPPGVDLTRPTATVLIVDDDRPVVLKWENTALSFNENGGWMVHADFATPIQSPVTVAFTVNPGTAIAADFTVTPPTTVQLPAGATFVELSGVFTQDLLYEGNETFSVTLSVTSGPAVVVADTAYITVLDSDPVPTVSFSGDQTANEGDLVQLPLTLTRSSATPLTIHWVGVATTPPNATVGRATAVADYPVSGVYTIAAGTDCVNAACTLPVRTVASTDLDAYLEVFGVQITSVDGGFVDPTQDTATVGIYDPTTAATVSLSAPAAVVESDGSVPITFTLSSALPVDAVVRLSVGLDARPGANSADPAADVVVPPGGLQATIPAGELSATVNLVVANDGIVESPETIALGVDSVSTSPEYIVATPATASYVTINDPVTPAASVSSTSVDENAGTATVNITLDHVAGPGGASFTYSSANGTAIAGIDYTATSGTLQFAAGQQIKSISVPVANDDSSVEPTESFTVTLTGATNATIAVSVSTVTVTDSDLAGLRVGSAVVLEGTAATGRTAVSLTVALDHRLLTDATYSWSITDGTGLVGLDVDAAPTGTFTVPQGLSSFTLPIKVVPDDLDEMNETVSVTLTPVSGPLTVVTGFGTVTITDDDLPVTVTAADAKVLENAGTALVTVTLDRPSLTALSIPFSTLAGTATAADFTSTTGSLAFAVGATSASVTVPIVNDTLVEGIAGESFNVVLTPVSNTVIARQATVVIVDDESPYLIVQSASQQTEGDTVSRSMTFTVTLSQPLTTAVTLSWAPVGITATGGVDFPLAGGTVTISRRKTTATITVPITPDTAIEGNETLALALSSTGAPIGSAATVGTIIDDDDVSLSISDASGVEGNRNTRSINFTVRLSAAKVEPVTVRWGTVDGTATVADGDYVSASGTLTIAAGQTSATIAVAVVGDRKVEPNETFGVVLSAPVRALIGSAGTATGTIINDD